MANVVGSPIPAPGSAGDTSGSGSSSSSSSGSGSTGASSSSGSAPSAGAGSTPISSTGPGGPNPTPPVAPGAPGASPDPSKPVDTGPLPPVVGTGDGAGAPVTTPTLPTPEAKQPSAEWVRRFWCLSAHAIAATIADVLCAVADALKEDKTGPASADTGVTADKKAA